MTIDCYTAIYVTPSVVEVYFVIQIFIKKHQSIVIKKPPKMGALYYSASSAIGSGFTLTNLSYSSIEPTRML